MKKVIGIVATVCVSSLLGIYAIAPVIEHITGLGSQLKVTYESGNLMVDDSANSNILDDTVGNDAVATGNEQSVNTDTVVLTATPIPTSTPMPTPTPTLDPTPTPEPTPTINYMDSVITVIGGIQADKSDFLFPESSSEILSQERMDEVLNSPDKDTRHKLSQLAINELLARYGFKFTRDSSTAEDARQQFNNKEWYKIARDLCPSTNYQVIYDNYFNYYERRNWDLLNLWQQEHGVYY